MKNTFRKAGFAILAASSLTMVATPVLAAEPILGNWTTQSGETAKISSCGDAYCIVLKTGEHAGKSIGRLEGADGNYKGTVTDPADDKEYSGFAKINNGRMELKGCALVIFCKTQIWNHQ